MAIHLLILVTLVFSCMVASQTTCTDNLVPRPDPANGHKLKVAEGFRARVFANNVVKPRGMVFDKDNNLLVVEKGVGITAFRLSDDGGACVKPVGQKTPVRRDTKLNHAIQLSMDGKTIFASGNDMVYSLPYDSSNMTTSADKITTWITGMTGRDHVTRTLLLSKKVPGLLLVSKGSSKNMDFSALQENSGTSQIRIFNVSSPRKAPGVFTDGTVLGWGLRNSVGMDEHPKTGGIWSNENASDDLYRDDIDVHEDTPGEEINFHGYLDGTPSGLKSKNYGYPYCASTWKMDDKFPRKEGLVIGRQFFLGGTTGIMKYKEEAFALEVVTKQVPAEAKMSDAKCADPEQYTPARLTLPSHWAPIDMKFNSKGTIAYMTSRGSWDKGTTSAPNASGFQLFAVLFDGTTGEPVEKPNSQKAAITILSNVNDQGCEHFGWRTLFSGPTNCITPTGIAFDKNGRLFMASEQTNEIFVITRKDGGSMDTVESNVLKNIQVAEEAADTKVPASILKVREESTWSTLWKMFGALKI